MKLASLPQGRDGRLIVVSNDLAWYADADHIVPTMQALLDDWDRNFATLQKVAESLRADGFSLAPLVAEKDLRVLAPVAPAGRLFYAVTLSSVGQAAIADLARHAGDEVIDGHGTQVARHAIDRKEAAVHTNHNRVLKR